MRSLKWGPIGAGDIVRRRVAPALAGLDSCEIVAVSRERAELAEGFETEFGINRWYADWRDLLADDEPRHWFIEKTKSGGGPMMDFGCHRLELPTYLFGDVGRMES